MLKVLTAEQMREVDRLTTERYGIPSIILMENAAHAVARVITEKLGGSVKGKSVLILCGRGNNGGDGAALARMLWTAGAVVSVFLFGKVEDTKGDARINFDILRSISNFHSRKEYDPYDKPDAGRIYFCEEHDGEYFRKRFRPLARPEVVVDAIFGTGLSRKLEENICQVVTSEWFDERSERDSLFLLISVDLPTGLRVRTDWADEISANADVTVTFTAPKIPNVLPPAAARNGELIIADIGSPMELINEANSQLYVSEEEDVRGLLHYWLNFESSDYKNKRGHALIVAGSEQYSGAAVMCGNSAMRSGVGLTTLLVPASCKVEVASRVIPEVIVGTIGENAGAIGKADSILIGPGLDVNDGEGGKLVREIVSTRTVPVILDAGALGFCEAPTSLLQEEPRDGSPPYEGGVASASFADDGVVLSSRDTSTSVVPRVENHPVAEAATPLLRKEASLERLQPLILTPHEGEFLRLLGTDDKDAIKDRVATVREFAVERNVILVLKGERVLIGSPDGRVVVNPTGNSGLGKAGNGDTLAGILAGFVAQAVKFEIDIFETVVAAVYVAGMAGDIAEKKYGKRVMTASDVRECLVDVFAEFEKKSY